LLGREASVNATGLGHVRSFNTCKVEGFALGMLTNRFRMVLSLMAIKSMSSLYLGTRKCGGGWCLLLNTFEET